MIKLLWEFVLHVFLDRVAEDLQLCKDGLDRVTEDVQLCKDGS
jgi:hypothetical protein